MSEITNEILQAASSFWFQTSLTPAATAASSTVEQSFTLSNASPRLQTSDTFYVSDVRGPSTNHVVMTSARSTGGSNLTIGYSNPNGSPQTYAAGLIQVNVVRLPVGTPTV
jgi:hypothetical protein